MKKIYLLLITALFSFSSLFAQAPAIQWQRTLGGSNNDFLSHLLPTSDGGYILGGHSASSASGDKTEQCVEGFDYWLVKLDANGTTRWEKTVGHKPWEFPDLLEQAADGGYLVAGVVRSDSSLLDSADNNICRMDWRITKLAANGQLQWQKVFGDGRRYLISSLLPTADSGCILQGYCQYSFTGQFDPNNWKGLDHEYSLLKLDRNGNRQWERKFDSRKQETILVAHCTNDGGYILGGSIASDIPGDTSQGKPGNLDYWILKLDFSGKTEWQNKYGGDEAESVLFLQQTADGGYVFSGPAAPNERFDFAQRDFMKGNENHLIKIDAAGKLKWQSNVGNFIGTPVFASTSAGGWIIFGHHPARLPIDGPPMMGGSIGGLEKLDASGKIQWQQYDREGYSPASLCATIDSGCMLGKIDDWRFQFSTDGFKLRSLDYKVGKIDPSGKVKWEKLYGANDTDELQIILPTRDGGCILAGSSKSNMSGDKMENSKGSYDYWVIKLAPDEPKGN